MGRILFVMNDAPYGSERSYNALRLAGALSKQAEAEVKIFLMGDAASCAKTNQKVPPGFYNVELMLQTPARHAAEIGVCWTCMDARGIAEMDLTDGVKRGTLAQLADWTIWSDKTLVF